VAEQLAFGRLVAMSYFASTESMSFAQLPPRTAGTSLVADDRPRACRRSVGEARQVGGLVDPLLGLRECRHDQHAVMSAARSAW